MHFRTTTHTNTATASATDDEGDSTSAQASATISYSDVTPSVSISKSAAPTSVSEGGVGSQSVTYTRSEERRVGKECSSLTVVVPDRDSTTIYESGDSNNDGKLDKGETWTYTLTTTAPTQNAGSTHTYAATT